MAHHKSAQKRIRQTERRTAVNSTRKSRVRSFLRKVETAIEAGDQSAAAEALKNAQPELMRSAQKGLFKKKAASRKMSRLSARVKAMAS